MVVRARPQYEIRSLAPATGYLAVYSHAVNGGIEIEMLPFDFVGVADMRIQRRGKWTSNGSEIVGVKLGDGFFDVVTDSVNCHGIVQEGATWADCLELLPSELQSRVVASESVHKRDDVQ